MIRFRDGEENLHIAKRPLYRPIILILIALSFLLAACGSRVANSNWPGLSTDGEHIFLAYGPEVIAYDAATQNVVWSYPAEKNATLQFYAAPDVQDKQVVFGDYGKTGGVFTPGVTVTAYAVEDIANGGIAPEKWTTSEQAHDKIVAPALQVGDQVFMGTADNFLLALDNNNGDFLWSLETGHSIWGKPTYRDGVVYATSMDRSLYAVDGDTGEVKWQTTFSGAMPSGPVLDTNLIYVSTFNGKVYAVNIDNGEVEWDFVATNAVWGTPAFADGVVYFGDVNGEVFAIDAQSGAQIWQVKTAGAVQTSPVVVGDKLYVASEGASGEVPIGALTAFAIADGREMWQKLSPAPLFTTPIVVDEAIVVALTSEEALLIAYDLETGGQLWQIAPRAES